MRLTTIYAGTNLNAPQRGVGLMLGQMEQLSVDLSTYCGLEGTTVDSATWSVLDSRPSVAIGSPVTGSQATSAIVTAADIGRAVIQASVVLANGETLIFLFRCSVTDPLLEQGAPVDRYCYP